MRKDYCEIQPIKRPGPGQPGPQHKQIMEIKTKYGIGDIVKFDYPYKSGKTITAEVVQIDIFVNINGRVFAKYMVVGNDCGYIWVKENHII